jgi:hypothetical protein
MKTFKQLLEQIDETLSLFVEEVEELDESNENFDSNSKAHQAAKKAVKGWRGVSKATYHSDGSATINTKDKTKNRYGKGGHYSGLETTHSHWAVNAHLKGAGGEWGHSRDEYDNHKQKIGGLHWKVKGKATSYGDTHEIHIHEGVEGLDELSRKTLSSYTASAARDMAHTARKHSDAQNAAADVNASLKKAKKKNNYDSPAHKQGEKLGHRWMNRAKGIDKATNRLAKEEVEQTDEALKGSQHKIDANKNGKVDGHDFKILRNQKKARYQ